MKPTRRDYCQFLISTQTNYTQTYFADHHQHFSHDAINRYLKDDDVKPAVVWEQVKGVIETDPAAYILFEDSVSDKNHSHKIELVRLQYSGNAHGLIKGIGIVNCLYVNPRTKRYWIIDWRVYAPDSDDKTKFVYMQEMFDDALNTKKLPFRVVLMDSWYATKDLMLHIHRAGKFFYCLLESIPGTWRFLVFTEKRCALGISAAERFASCQGQRPWHSIEKYHREVKQALGLEKCQCRSAKAQHNHISSVILA